MLLPVVVVVFNLMVLYSVRGGCWGVELGHLGRIMALIVSWRRSVVLWSRWIWWIAHGARTNVTIMFVTLQYSSGSAWTVYMYKAAAGWNRHVTQRGDDTKQTRKKHSKKSSIPDRLNESTMIQSFGINCSTRHVTYCAHTVSVYLSVCVCAWGCRVAHVSP